MHPTLNDLPVGDRRKLIALLSGHVADAMDLYTQVKHAHWNVKGPSFIALHELFDKIAGEVLEYVDEIAERAVALGGVVEGTARSVARNTRLSEYPMKAVAGPEHTKAVAKALAAFGASARAAIDAADKLGDKDTADLYTGISREIDKLLWFVEAHLHARA